MRVNALLFMALCIYAQTSQAGDFMAGFAQGFSKTTSETLERRQCEKEYSPSMCTQMQADKEQKAEQARRNQQTQDDLNRMGARVNQLEYQNATQQQELDRQRH